MVAKVRTLLLAVLSVFVILHSGRQIHEANSAKLPPSRPHQEEAPHNGTGRPSGGVPRRFLQDAAAEDQAGAAPTVVFQDAPSTAAVLGGVLGGLLGLSLVLAGALLVASGTINRWRWCAGWQPLQADDGRSSFRGSPSSRRLSVARQSTSTQPYPSAYAPPSPPAAAAGAGAMLAPQYGASSEVWHLLSSAPPGQLTAARPPGRSPHGSGGAGAAAAAAAGGGGGADSGGYGGGAEELPGPSFGNGSKNVCSGGSAGEDQSVPGSQGAENKSPPAPLGADMGLRDCLVDPTKIQVLRRPNGQPWRLGGGSYGQVYKALYDDVQVVAVKVLAGMSDPASLQSFLQEGRILRECRDRNIVQFVGVAFDPDSDQAMLVTEYMESGDLWKALRWRDAQGRRVFGWHRRGKKAALDAARGLYYLHSRRILHLDLKSANILLTRDGTAKLADVGLAKMMTKNYLSAVSLLGTFAWCAPEVLTGQRCDEKADIFSYGVVLWEICTGEAPGRGAMRNMEVPGECPSEIQDLCDRCMSADPKLRPSAKDLVMALEKAVGDVDRANTVSGSLSGLSMLTTSPSKLTAGPVGYALLPAPSGASDSSQQAQQAEQGMQMPPQRQQQHRQQVDPSHPLVGVGSAARDVPLQQRSSGSTEAAMSVQEGQGPPSSVQVELTLRDAGGVSAGQGGLEASLSLGPSPAAAPGVEAGGDAAAAGLGAAGTGIDLEAAAGLRVAGAGINTARSEAGAAGAGVAAAGVAAAAGAAPAALLLQRSNSTCGAIPDPLGQLPTRRGLSEGNEAAGAAGEQLPWLGFGGRQSPMRVSRSSVGLTSPFGALALRSAFSSESGGDFVDSPPAPDAQQAGPHMLPFQRSGSGIQEGRGGSCGAQQAQQQGTQQADIQAAWQGQHSAQHGQHDPQESTQQGAQRAEIQGAQQATQQATQQGQHSAQEGAQRSRRAGARHQKVLSLDDNDSVPSPFELLLAAPSLPFGQRSGQAAAGNQAAAGEHL